MANKMTILALASAAAALAIAASAVAEEFSTSGENINTPAQEPPAAEAPKRGRPPGQPAADKKAPEGKTLDELKEIIKPLVAEGRGAEIKAILKKLDCEALKDLPAEKQAAFLKDVEALSI